MFCCAMCSHLHGSVLVFDADFQWVCVRTSRDPLSCVNEPGERVRVYAHQSLSGLEIIGPGFLGTLTTVFSALSRHDRVPCRGGLLEG